MKILFVSTDTANADLLVSALAEEGYETLIARDAEGCIDMAFNEVPDLLVVDIDLPGVSGFSVCRELRQNSRIPIILTASCEEEPECIKALEVGADDCAPRPPRIRELLLRIRNALRQQGKGMVKAGRRATKFYLPPVHQGDFLIDAKLHEVRVRGREVFVPRGEFKMLHYLAAHAGQVVRQETLRELIWDDPNPEETTQSNVVAALMVRLRKRIEPDPPHPKHLVTVRGVGYVFKF